MTAYRPEWVTEYGALAGRIRAIAGAGAARIDHIGSTAVPGLAAKDVVDIQISVADLGAAEGLLEALRSAGFRGGHEMEHDVFHFVPAGDAALRKRFLREPAGERRAHVHVRELGRFNQRYALLFRDYLRASDRVRNEYARLKRHAAALFPADIDGYLALKEPVLHIIHEAACLWAERTGWMPDADFR